MTQEMPSEELLKCFIEQLERDAFNGSKVAKYTLGLRYSSHAATPDDLKVALSYYTDSARRNFAPAQNNVGWAYRMGLGTEVNLEVAYAWFYLAALQGNPLAIQNLGEMFQLGEGVQQSAELAEALFRFGAAQAMTPSDQESQGGCNNAIHECRRELAWIHYQRALSGRGEEARMAAMWLRVAIHDVERFDCLVDDGDLASFEKTKELHTTIKTRLTIDEEKWISEVVENWDKERAVFLDMTDFPLTTAPFYSMLVFDGEPLAPAVPYQ